jgi:hypothetical protein
VDCEASFADIGEKLTLVLSQSFKDICKKCHNPYEKFGTASEIYNVIKDFKLDKLINKCFHNITNEKL